APGAGGAAVSRGPDLARLADGRDVGLTKGPDVRAVVRDVVDAVHEGRAHTLDGRTVPLPESPPGRRPVDVVLAIDHRLMRRHPAVRRLGPRANHLEGGGIHAVERRATVEVPCRRAAITHGLCCPRWKHIAGEARVGN